MKSLDYLPAYTQKSMRQSVQKKASVTRPSFVAHQLSAEDLY